MPGAPAPSALPLPALTLSAPKQLLRAGDPLFVRARCSAACDLRAVTRTRDPVFDEPLGYGAAELTRAGTARSRVLSWAGDTLVPDRPGGPTIIVTATAPGGTTPVIRRPGGGCAARAGRVAASARSTCVSSARARASS